MLVHYITRKNNTETTSLDLYETTLASNLLLTDFSHEQADHKLMILPENLAFNSRRFRKKKIVLLTRDPRDTAVSMHFQLTRRETIARDTFYTGSLSDLLRDPYFGLEKIIKFNRMWSDNGAHCRDFMPVRYEDMRENPQPVLRGILQFLGEESPDDNLVTEACQAAEFDKMKQQEL